MFSVFALVKYSYFVNPIPLNRNQLDDKDDLSLSLENVARQFRFSDEAESTGIKRNNQKRQTDQSSRQECGYAMLAPRTAVVISTKVSIQ